MIDLGLEIPTELHSQYYSRIVEMLRNALPESNLKPHHSLRKLPHSSYCYRSPLSSGTPIQAFKPSLMYSTHKYLTVNRLL
jgi:hypothetical protein